MLLYPSRLFSIWALYFLPTLAPEPITEPRIMVSAPKRPRMSSTALSSFRALSLPSSQNIHCWAYSSLSRSAALCRADEAGYAYPTAHQTGFGKACAAYFVGYIGRLRQLFLVGPVFEVVAPYGD